MKAKFLTAKAALAVAFAVSFVEFVISGDEARVAVTGQAKFHLTTGGKILESLAFGSVVFIVVRSIQWGVSHEQAKRDQHR